MSIGQTFRVLTLLAATLVLSACRQSAVWHQKLMLVVDTPQGEVTGSSVISVSFRANIAIFGEMDSPIQRMTGEAAVVEVLPGKYLFALLGDQDHLIYDRVMEPGKSFAAAIPAILAQRDPLTLYPFQPPKPNDASSFPMLVTFDDIADPKSVKLVDPNDLAASFGPGVLLKSVTVQVTDEQATEGRVEAVLGWVLDAGRHRMSVIPKPDGLERARNLSELTPEERIPLEGFLSIDHWSSK